MFEDLLTCYEACEPAGTDAWNPLGNELELWHRTRLWVELTTVLRALPGSIAKARALDVGCGVGRSTRMLLELGFRPENVWGIDLRSSAIDYARQLNPAIRFRAVSSFSDWPLETRFDLCLQCTAFSSITGTAQRQLTAQMMERSVGNQGFIFWWDRRRANDFAGNDPLDPAAFFTNMHLLSLRTIPLWPCVEESLRPLRGLRGVLAPVLGRLGYPATHIAAFFGPKAI